MKLEGIMLERSNMKLEDFFTPIEMKVGLASVSRVEQLVTLMQQEKFHNIDEAIYQCSTVAIVLSATQNADCLRQFIQLGGLRYLDKWFQEVLRYNDKSADEVITAVLDAFEKLPMDQEGLKSCGIGNALGYLCSHKNMEIQGRARNLSESWEKIMILNAEFQENGKCGLSHDGENRFMAEATQDEENSNCEKACMRGVDSPKGGASSCKLQQSSLAGRSSEAVKDNKVQHSSQGTSEASSSSDIGPTSPKDVTGDRKNSEVSAHDDGPCSADVQAKQKTTSIVIGNNHSLQKQPPNNLALELVDDVSSSYWKKIMEQKPENMADGSKAMKNATTTLLGNQNSLGKIKHEVESCRTEGSGKELYMNIESGLRTNVDEKSVNMRAYQKNSEEIRKKSEMDISYEEDDALEVARQVAIEVEEAVGIYREASCSSSVKDTDSETVEMTTADSIEVKQTESLTGIRDKSESYTGHDIPESCCSTKEEVDTQISAGSELLCMGVKGISHEICATMLEKDEILHEQESSQITTVPHEPADSERTHPCTFDLNEDVEAEEIECHEQSIATTVSPSHIINLPAPIPVVATSRGPVGLPVTPLHFGGELGWKGSAATSAFRPASTRRTPDKDRVCSTEENKCNSKNLQCFRGIDLNVADAGDDAAMDVFSSKHVPVSSSLPSGDSSAEVSSNRAERLNFDLNRLGDNDDNCQDLLSDHRHRNGACSPSASSSSRPSMRDFDLNDNPCLGEAHDFHRPGQGLRPLRNGRLDDPVVSILGSGTQLEPNIHANLGSMQGFGHSRKEFLNHPSSFLMSAPGIVPSVGPMGRMVQVQPTLAYATAPAFSYNGLGLGTIPLPPVYASGAVPYMVDSRGTTVIPQILGSSSTLSPFPRAPYLMGVSGSAGTNDIGFLRPNLDLNAGLTSLDADNREGGNMRHMFFPTSNSLVEEQMKSFQQVSMSGPSLKRKEPECGRDPYQVGYKQVTSWH